MLYVVATPIGNLKDLSFRAVEVLNSVDMIACEDTRHSLKLLNAYEIKKPLIAYHKFNERESGLKIIEELKSGKNIALVSDAGTPLVSDPGSVLTKMLIEEGLEFTVVPGACAFVPALILSGMDSSRFCFLGFLPEKQSERREFLSKYVNLDMTLIFYSAPHDIERNVGYLSEAFGNRRAVAVREITKVFEEAVPFNLAEGYNGEKRGEFVIIVEGASAESELNNLSPKEHIDYYIANGMDKKDALKKVAKERGVSKSELYKYTIED
jgi:16S rRNA (cytidine1402-2'-O)-methyltransferase